LRFGIEHHQIEGYNHQPRGLHDDN
jgi:hypothetical protein